MLIQSVTGDSIAIPAAVNGNNAGLPVIAALSPQTGSAPVEPTQTPAQPVASSQPPQVPQVNDAQLQSAISKLNQAMTQSNINLEFSIDPSADRTLIKVVDSQTGDVIKQIPSNEMIAIANAIDQFQKGLLVKQQA